MDDNKDRVLVLAERGYVTQVLRDEISDGEFIYLALNPELEGCMAQGGTPEEAYENLKEVRVDYIEHLLDHNLPVPEPLTTTTSSGIQVPPDSTPVIQVDGKDLVFPDKLKLDSQPDEREILYESSPKT